MRQMIRKISTGRLYTFNPKLVEKPDHEVVNIDENGVIHEDKGVDLKEIEAMPRYELMKKAKELKISEIANKKNPALVMEIYEKLNEERYEQHSEDS